MKERRERALILALSFAVPGLVMLWAYASLGIAPFGDRTVLVSDMSIQYVDFFCALKGGDLFFSWSKALGTGYIGVFSYYMSSPLSLLTLLVPNENMPVGLALLTVLKIALAGLSFCYFVQRRFPGCGVAALICSVCYALMSYNAAYSLCVMWLDGVIWLPLILLALERVLAGRSAGPFIAALTACFISTWYISYMIGIFCALYLCVRLIGLRPVGQALKMVLLRFFGGAACALGLTAWLWLPTFLAMFIGKFSGANPSYYSSLVLFSPVLLVSRLLPGQYGGIAYALPYVFCGTAVLILVLAHFSFWEPYGREKLAERAVLVVLILSMIFSPLDKVWHLFQVPHWFPFRYAFLFSFFLLYLSIQALAPALRALGKRYGRGMERGAALALAVFTVVEMGINARVLLAGIQEQYGSDSYQSYQDTYAANAQLVSAAEADSGGAFFRMGAAEDRGFNSPLAFGYPGLTHYSSLYHYNLNCLLKQLGFAQDWFWCVYYGSTPVTDALLGMEYVAAREQIPGYEPVAQADGLTLWKNPDALPMAFLAEENVPELEGGTPFERLNNLISSLLGERTAVFDAAPAVDLLETPDETTFRFTGTGNPIYMDLSADGLKAVLVNDGERALALGTSEAACVHYLGTPEAGEVWTVAVEHESGWNGWLWELHRDALHAAAEKLNNTQITEVGKNGTVRLNVSVAEERYGQYLLTTIPAENGWTAYVDGKRSGTGLWLDTFLLVPLSAGEHTVELRYTAPGLIPGAALGVVSAAALIGLWALRRRKKA